MSTAVKPLLPPLNPKAVTPFVPRNTAPQGLSGLSEEAELPHATQSLSGSPHVSVRALNQDHLIDINPEDAQHTSKWRTLLLQHHTSIWQLIVAASKTTAAVPGYIMTVVNGTRWRQIRMRQKVLIQRCSCTDLDGVKCVLLYAYMYIACVHNFCTQATMHRLHLPCAEPCTQTRIHAG